MKRPFVLVALLAAPLAGCGGPPVVTPIEDEPICPDFEVGVTKTKMHGGLRRPIYVEVLEDGDAIAKITLFGRNGEKAKKTPVVLTDQDDDLAVHWRQCENEHAPSPLSDVKVKHVIKYECGPSDFYASDTLTTRAGQIDTMTLHVPPPPDARCWGDGDVEDTGAEGDEAADGGALADAGEPDAGDADAGDAGATEGDAEGNAGAGGAPSGDVAAPPGSASAKPDAKPPTPKPPTPPKPPPVPPPAPPPVPAPPPSAAPPPAP